jgi:dTDP-4-dehydrorhamnose reductase
VVKAIIVGEAPAMAAALRLQFGHRGYPVACTQTDARALEFAAEEGACPIVIADCSGQLAGQTLAFPIFRQLVDDCLARGWPLLMLSDSRVFPIARNQRYRERDLTGPAVREGVQLLQYEQYLAENSERHIIVRTGPLLASSGNNWLTYLVQRLQAGESIAAAGEPRFCPTAVADLARVIAAICDQVDCSAQCWGVYHYHSADTATFYELAEVVLAAASQYWNLSGSVHLQASATESWGSEFPMLNCQKIRDTFGIQQLQWRKAIPDLLKQMQVGETT